MGRIIKVSDYIAESIALHNDTAKCVFMVSGGGNMHLIDSLGRNKGLSYICNHNEQACSLAAEGYARASNKIGISYVTTGPGGTNAITGVYSAWVDSIPTLTISGQVKSITTIASQPEINLRQLGDQEVNIIDLVKPITKYSVLVKDKHKIKYHLKKALYLSKSERPGPVWIDIPTDIQGSLVDEADLLNFVIPPKPIFDNKLAEIISLLQKAKRPVIIAGNGIVLANGKDVFISLVEALKIPVISTFARYDIVKNDNPYFFGRYGTVGNRMANFTVQNSDLVIAIGTRMNIRAISYNWEFFAREAKKVVVDIDKNELAKHTLEIDVKVNSDAKSFIQNLYREIQKIELPTYKTWLNKCKEYKQRHPTLDIERTTFVNYVDSYNFFDKLSDVTSDDMIYIFGNGTACVSSYQSLRLKKDQKVIVNSGAAAMGYDLPAAIGACVANGKKEVICVTGDGSLQMNLQELQTIIHNKLPIKIFVLNNGGYISIRNTQNSFFKGNKVGSDMDSGVSFPDTIKLAKAYGFKTFKIDNQIDLTQSIKEVVGFESACVCEVILSNKEKMYPKLSSEIKSDGRMISKPLEDMFPFIDRDEFQKNMIVDIIKE